MRSRRILSLSMTSRVTFEAMTHAPTSSIVLARLKRKSPGRTNSAGSKRSGSSQVLLSSSSYSPQVTALTLTTPTSPASGGRSLHLKLAPASMSPTIWPTLAQHQPSGRSVKRIIVRRAVARGLIGTPKNGKAREVPLSDQAAAALGDHPGRGDLVFCAPDGAMLTRGSTKWPLRRALARAGLRSIGWHCLRHTFASHLVMRGAPLKSVQELLGHSTIEMTMRYSHLSPDARRDAVRLLDVKEPMSVVWRTSKGTVLRIPLDRSPPRFQALPFAHRLVAA